MTPHVRAVFLVLALVARAVADDAESPYAGQDVCEACHEEQAKKHATSPHATPLADPARPPAERGCEACHGPGAAHASEGGGRGVGGIRSFASETRASDRNAPCLHCHQGESALHAFARSPHRDQACTGCHAIHGARAPKLLRGDPPGLCYGCHPDVRAAFALPENHGVDRGTVECTDCHAPHGARDRAALAGSVDRACMRCHAEVQGPFVFEHVALVTEGCTACHTPHGSSNRHLLIREQVAQLCSECHTVTPANHAVPSYRDCTRCHVSIHGSNTDPRFLEP